MKEYNVDWCGGVQLWVKFRRWERKKKGKKEIVIYSWHLASGILGLLGEYLLVTGILEYMASDGIELLNKQDLNQKAEGSIFSSFDNDTGRSWAVSIYALLNHLSY
jgi:hypothetical protein